MTSHVASDCSTLYHRHAAGHVRCVDTAGGAGLRLARR